MDTFTDQEMQTNCPHCDRHSFALQHPLKETGRFWVVCDVHPLTAGHILIIPKKHISCIGNYDMPTLSEFNILFHEVSLFLTKQYGSVSAFEHGLLGQTVFHSHTQLFPFTGPPEQIITEGAAYYHSIPSVNSLRTQFELEKKYLFFSIEGRMWVVDTRIGHQGFFRNRFGNALKNPERANWKKMHNDLELMNQAKIEIESLKVKWHSQNV